MNLSKLSRANFDQKKKNLLEQFLPSLHCNNLSPLPNSYDSKCLSKIFGFGIFSIKQADYLLLYEQNWLKEGTEALVLKKTAESSK